MVLEIEVGKDEDSKQWDEIVHASPHGNIFHTWKWLKIVEKHTSNTFYPLILSHGGNIAAIYPIFLQRKAFINLALSPPSHAYLLYLGPVIPGYESKKQDKKESIFTEIQLIVDDFIKTNLNAKYSRIRLSPGLFDPRPLRWCGYTIDPLFTYRLNLNEGKESIWNQFDRKLRVGINRAKKDGVIVREGERDDLELVERELTRRRQEQGLETKDHSRYLFELYENFRDHMKIFLAYYQEKNVGSLVALTFKDTTRLWIGTPKSGLKGIYPNDLVQWEAIQWACDHGFRWFENMDGGDNQRLTIYKSKYNPEPYIWYSAVKHSSMIYKIGESLLRL